MMLPSHVLVLLDTSVLVHLARRDPTGALIENHFALTARADRPLISTITEGEILGFSRQRNWVLLGWLNSLDCWAKSFGSMQEFPRSSTPTQT